MDMVPGIGQLRHADEFLNHQIVNTHATVGTADRGWTEKIWFTLMRKDAQLQASFGLGQYANRNLIDGFAGLAHGTTQRTVRASRLLQADPNAMSAGPLRYEVLDPLRQVRLVLDANQAQPLQFDLVFSGLLPPFFEGRDLMLDSNGRTASDLVRYHQAGTVSGWIECAGERIAVKPEEWFGFRDHSWGVREHVGAEPTDLPPAHREKIGGFDMHFNWFVSQLERPDGSRYELAYYFREFSDRRGLEFFSGYINEADGRQIPLLRVHPELSYRSSDRSVIGGRIYALLAGEGRRTVERVFEVEAINAEMGFRLHPGMYGPWQGQVHGSFMGEAFIDGECIEDVNHPDKLSSNPRWALRDRPLRIREGGNHGYADLESLVHGSWPNVKWV
jgi:hypothetical protein